MFTDLALVGLITSPTVVGQKGDFVTSGESPQNVVRANLAAGINRNKLARFDPQDFHRFFTKALLKNKLIVFKTESRFTAEERRAQRPRRDQEERERASLFPSARPLRPPRLCGEL